MAEDLDLDKVFSSNITRHENHSTNNDLYSLLSIAPATPVITQNSKNDTLQCTFYPNTCKYYISKRKSRLKVKTVRNIRDIFEKDTYSYLTDDLNKQEKVLLKKIRDGSSKDENTNILAQDMLNTNNPISRSAWQMLVNLNPKNYKNTKQFVLWNGTYIHVNGSIGGNHKLIFNYDLAGASAHVNKTFLKKNTWNQRTSLLKNSLSVKFKPGPLRKKQYLDDSHQKYNVGKIELVHLPKLGLEVQPVYGVPLDTSMTNILNKLRDETGIISPKWAEFAVSVSGIVNKSNLLHLNSDKPVMFDLNYKYDQNRILMRKDTDTDFNIVNKHRESVEPHYVTNENCILSEVKQIINRIVDAVEISLIQDKLYTEVDYSQEYLNADTDFLSVNHKEKTKRKYCELDRLDVTVIQLPQAKGENQSDTCRNSYCLLGCICESLQCKYNLKRHCGLLECMFGCTCDFSKYKDIALFENECSEIIPGLFNLDNEIKLKLAKEEQKFRQTVICSGEKRILLKSEKRKSKAATKYADFYCSADLKQNKIEKELSVVTTKLIFRNIEPWCMVHNLYKCFCKGRFIEPCVHDIDINVSKSVAANESKGQFIQTYVPDIDNNVNKVVAADEPCQEGIDWEQHIDNSARTSQIITRQAIRRSAENTNPFEFCQDDENSNTSARVTGFSGRKYNLIYYKNTNKKILEMEKNDNNLQDKLIYLTKNCNNDDVQDINTLPLTSQPLVDKESEIHLEPQNRQRTESVDGAQSDIPNFFLKQVSSANIPPAGLKLVSWIEESYKHYKKQLHKGIKEKSLEPPKLGKLALYTWDFIFNRYKERKNFFLVSKEKPFRIFMAVNVKQPAFENCINIDDIRLADLYTYPVAVKKLLTNSTEFKDVFCILRGLPHCWELVGSVTKNTEESGDSSMSAEGFNVCETSISGIKHTTADSSALIHTLTNLTDTFTNDTENDTEEHKTSRWFVMRIENDFSEIQFHNKGFFVKYESILKAINVARQSGKTVRLSSQKCCEKNNGPQFGIYAIPNLNEYCVFVGPYEVDEPLGIETVKTFLDIRKKKRTRGIWITTDKVDNLNVINNPMLFMPSTDMGFKEMVSIFKDRDETEVKNRTDIENTKNETSNTTASMPTNPKIKVVKPFKVHKGENIIQLRSKSILNTSNSGIHKRVGSENTKTASCISEDRINLVSNTSSQKIDSKNTLEITNSLLKNSLDKISFTSAPAMNAGKLLEMKPVAEIAPQVNIEIQNILRERDKKSENPLSAERGMLILKPEEINRKVFQNNDVKAGSSKDNESNFKEESEEITKDIEVFLSSPVACDKDVDVCVISDDDDDDKNNDDDGDIEMRSNSVGWKNVKIQCKNVNCALWVPGRKRTDNLLSFEFPGCKPSKFYKETVAYSEINCILSQQVYVPTNIVLEWQVIESVEELEDEQNILKREFLNTDYVLTRRGFRHRSTIDSYLKKVYKKTPSLKKNIFLNKTIKRIHHESTVQKTGSTLEENDCTIQLTGSTIGETDTTMREIESTVEETETTIQLIGPTIEQTDTTMQETESTVEETDTNIQLIGSTIEETDTTIQETESTVEETDTTIRLTESTLQEIGITIEGISSTVEETDSRIQLTESTLQEIGITIEGISSTVEETDSRIQLTESTLQEAGITIQGIVCTVEETDSTLQIIGSTIEETDTTIQEIASTIQETGITIQDAIVLEDGSVFIMDEENKNKINQKLTTSTDAERLEAIQILELLKSQNNDMTE